MQTLMEELEPEEQFLQCARNGDLLGIQRLLMSKIKEETQININCKGRGVTSSDLQKHTRFSRTLCCVGMIQITVCLWIVRQEKVEPGMDASPPGLLLWTQRCSGGVTEGAALIWSICLSLWTAVSYVPAVTPRRLGLMSTCPTTSETRRCTKLPSPEERCIYTLHTFSFFRLFAPLSCVKRLCCANHPLNQSSNPDLIRRLSCCCYTMMHVRRSSMGARTFPKTSLKTQRSEACWKVRAACQDCRSTARRVDSITVSPCVFAHAIAWCVIVEIWAFLFLMNTSGGENRGEETGGETSGSCTRRRPFNFEPAGSCYTT